MFKYWFLIKKMKTLEKMRKHHLRSAEAWIMTVGDADSPEGRRYCYQMALKDREEARKLESQIKLLT